MVVGVGAGGRRKTRHGTLAAITTLAFGTLLPSKRIDYDLDDRAAFNGMVDSSNG